MLRSLALVLLLANALLLAALSGVLDTGVDSEREPERLQRQQQTDLVRILSPQAASAALEAASAASAASSQAAAAAASSAMATVCLEAGPFSAADAAAAERSLHEAGLAPGSWQVQRQDDGGAFMIYMGRYADRETLLRKLAELKRMKLNAEDLHSAPALQPGINLGHFDNLAAANAAMAQMAQRGVRTARVITLRQAQSQTVLRVPAADASQRARLAGLQLPSGPGFLPCAAGAAGVVVATGSAAPASAAAAASAAAPAPATSPSAAPAAAVAATSAAPLAARPAASAPAPAAAPPASAAAPPAKRAATGPVNPAAGASTRAALARAASAVAAEASAGAKR